LEVIHEQGKNLVSFVHSYRTLLNVPEPDLNLVPANRLLERVKLLIHRDKNIGQLQIDWVSEPEDLELFIDEKQITQVLVNLGKNAIQSLKENEKGHIKIMAGLNKSGKKYIEVWDNGPGIPLEFLEEIFIPFFTTKNTGTGIGLSLSKQIMRLHGGSLEVHSIPDRETSFVLTF
jgi:signal transduction histidine kinase